MAIRCFHDQKFHGYRKLEVQREYFKAIEKDSKRWSIECQIKSEVFGMKETYDSNIGKYVVPQPIEGKH